MDWTISHMHGRFYIEANLHDQEAVCDFITILNAISAVIGERDARELKALAAQYEKAMSSLDGCPAQATSLDVKEK